MGWLACLHGRCWWWCATRISWDPCYCLDAHPSAAAYSAAFPGRLALARNCFARTFWELSLSTHSPRYPIVSNWLRLGVTKALFPFFRAGQTLPGSLCLRDTCGIGLKLDFIQNHIIAPFFPCPCLLPLLSPWELSLDNSCAHLKVVSVKPDLRQTQFLEGNHVDCQPNSGKASFKKQWPFYWTFLCP